MEILISAFLHPQNQLLSFRYPKKINFILIYKYKFFEIKKIEFNKHIEYFFL